MVRATRGSPEVAWPVGRVFLGIFSKWVDMTQTLHGTVIFADQLGWRQRGQLIGIYGSPMECLGDLG